ncbi:LrgB family protein [Saliterribacillus persicus]|uniref:Putative murein hydrolase (TIGR00659 family) n=1 Tax=Saliterribacillus persicus TaxID=930114 RepID=A0A368X4V9_9BACI|nr:LrgB family protein [Saliterribacillus persicus]RCW62845.1 putative murein hydrolase (TIGR00659 family) [Saliterribacillus persicus]
MSNFLIGTAFLSATVFIFFLTKWIYARFPSPFSLPIFLSTIAIVGFLSISNISYDTYMIGGQWINQLLGPVVVALALPLYRQRKLLLKYMKPIIIGTFMGSAIGILSGFSLVKLFDFNKDIALSVSAKSVTTPVALSITEQLEGIISLAAVFVMIAGIGGAVMGPSLLRLVNLHHPVVRGIGIGTASHAIGTARIMDDSELAGAVSAVSMTISALFVAILAPFLINLF